MGTSALTGIQAAGKVSGTPGAVEEAAKNVDMGMLYQYTHIPTFLSSQATHFLKTVERS